MVKNYELKPKPEAVTETHTETTDSFSDYFDDNDVAYAMWLKFDIIFGLVVPNRSL